MRRSVSSIAKARSSEQTAQLKGLKSGLTPCIGCGCLSLQTCALSNPVTGQAGGPGPAVLDGRSTAVGGRSPVVSRTAPAPMDFPGLRGIGSPVMGKTAIS
jgi:hypothetical protein